VVRLLLDSAGVRERQKEMQEAEERLHRALGIQPACEEAITRLEVLYRQTGRLQDLASLLERRLGGLLERLPPGDQRRLRALELADVYERLGNTYEAIGAWHRRRRRRHLRRRNWSCNHKSRELRRGCNPPQSETFISASLD